MQVKEVGEANFGSKLKEDKGQRVTLLLVCDQGKSEHASERSWRSQFWQ